MSNNYSTYEPENNQQSCLRCDGDHTPVMNTGKISTTGRYSIWHAPYATGETMKFYLYFLWAFNKRRFAFSLSPSWSTETILIAFTRGMFRLS